MLKMQIFGPDKNYKRKLLTPAALVFLFILAAPIIAKATTLVSQSFVTDTNLPVGSIVSLHKGTTDHVDSATTANVNDILGVVVNSNNSQLTISTGQSNVVNVATNGVEQVLVSDINGPISVGDAITSSPISGVGMKATSNTKVIGVSQDNFPNSNSAKNTYKDKSGKQETVMLGQVPSLINVTYYYKQPDKTLIPTALQKIADALANKKVNSLPIIISMIIFILTMVIVVSIIYSMIHSSIISVGRNPMSQAAIYRNVIQLSALVIVIIAVGLGAIFLVLTKF